MRLLLPILLLCLLLQSVPSSGQTARSALLRKCSPALTQQGLAPNAYALQVKDLPAFQIWAESQKLHIVRTYAPTHIVVVEATPSVFWEKILPQNAVQYADEGAAIIREELKVPGHNHFVNRVSAAHARWPHLLGAGISVSVKEQRFDSSDVDLRGRYQSSPKSAADVSDHATIMASIVAGAGNSDPAGRGSAPAAQLSSANSLGLLPDDPADYLAQNTSIQNHSYGTAVQPWYGPSALAYDHSTTLRPSLLHVFSAGNDGTETSPTGTYANLTGFANLTGSFKMAKNVLTVGSIDSFGQVSPISSRGPAYDGRTKPDLTAFGAGGTSDAAALSSGAAAVLQQAFREKNGTLPAAHTLRAVLLNTADDIAPPGPDFASGYGSLNLKNALRTVLSQQTETAEIASGETRAFPLAVPPQTRHLRVMLAWDDPPAALGTSPALINDLDLTLLAPDGSVLRPWSLNTAPHPDSLRQPARRGRDSLSNAEQVVADFPPPGLYQMQVHGRRVLPENQSFVLTFAWDTVGHFEWDCPVRNDPAIANRGTVLRWATNLAATTGHIQWKPTGSAEWHTIDPAAPLASGYRRWLMPDTFTAAQVRMVADGRAFLSDTFLIAPELRMRVGFDCPDSVLLHWNSAGPAATYQLWGLGDRYLEPLLTTADTHQVFQKKKFPQARFAVSVSREGEVGVVGPKSAAPDISAQGAGCYIATFLAQLNEDFKVDLHLQLGTTYGVRRVFFEKIKNDGTAVLHEEVPEQEVIMHTDLVPDFGANRYVARVELLGGSHFRSDTVTVYHAGESTWRILANPVPRGGRLTLLSRTADESVLELYDVLGRRVLEQKLVGELRTDLVLPSALPPGCYVWRVLDRSGECSGNGRLVIAGI